MPDLAEFPATVLPAGTLLYRVHRAGRSPWWFSSDGSGRFDLSAPHGTCYLAEEPLAALLEIARGLTVLSEAFLSGRRLFTAVFARELRLADLTASAAYAFGVTAELSANSDYGESHRWAAVLHTAGFDGIRYHIRHDPTGAQIGIAWFGAAGELTVPPEGYGQPLPPDLLLAAAPFGIRIAQSLPAD